MLPERHLAVSADRAADVAREAAKFSAVADIARVRLARAETDGVPAADLGMALLHDVELAFDEVAATIRRIIIIGDDGAASVSTAALADLPGALALAAATHARFRQRGHELLLAGGAMGWA